MSTRTEAHHLTREEGAGYCAALKDMAEWHAAQAVARREEITKLKGSLEGKLAEGLVAIALIEEELKVHRAAGVEIARLEKQQVKRTFGK